MSTPVFYNPNPSYTAGQTLIQITPAIASIDAMKLTEANAVTAVQIHCATEAFEALTTTSTVTRKMICDTVAVESPGSRTYTMSQLTIMLGDPQGAANAALNLLTLDAVLFLVLRPGLQAGKAGSAAWAVGQKYMALKVKVTSVDMRAISNAEGDEYAALVSFAVQDRTQLFGTTVA